MVTPLQYLETLNCPCVSHTKAECFNLAHSNKHMRFHQKNQWWWETPKLYDCCKKGIEYHVNKEIKYAKKKLKVEYTINPISGELNKSGNKLYGNYIVVINDTSIGHVNKYDDIIFNKVH